MGMGTSQMGVGLSQHAGLGINQMGIGIIINQIPEVGMGINQMGMGINRINPFATGVLYKGPGYPLRSVESST
jgi:hypothetical protein